MTAPIFVLSAPRTGSTLLRYILDTHSDVCSPGELCLGRLCEVMVVTLQRSLGQIEGHPMAAGREALLRGVRAEVERYPDEYRRHRGARVWCDKSPENVDYLNALEAVFPDARYVCLHRDALETAWSALGVDGVEDSGDVGEGQVTAALEAWATKTGKLLDFEAAHSESCRRVRYEDLARAPEATLRPLFEFLELPWEDDLLERVFVTSHDVGGGDPKVAFAREIRTAHLGRGSRALEGRVPERLRPRLAELLEELGYPPLAAGRERAFAGDGGADGAGGAPSPAALDTETIFTRLLPGVLAAKAERLGDTRSVFRFIVTDARPSTWTVDLTRRPPTVGSGEEGEADLTLTTTENVLTRIVGGEIDPFAAHREGLLRIEGDPELSYKLGLFF